MENVVVGSARTYADNIKLVLLFSIPFVISFLIPVFVSLPTFVSVGGIFLRSASIFINLNLYSIAVIVISIFISLLFLSFAYVAINLIVKARRTRTKNTRAMLARIEVYTGKVFVLFLVYTFIIALVNLLGYYVHMSSILTPIVGFFAFLPLFFAPSAITIDNKGIWRALVDSTKLLVKAPQYFVEWIVLLVVILSLVDLASVALGGTALSGYVSLVISTLFVLPYFVIFQAEAYMYRFPLLRH
ncbi:MAG: hypothetical protein ACP5MK_00305 [Candidatus Micrarchaeia archaeon]